MANNVKNSCRIWPNLINSPGEVQGMYGNMDHLLPLLSSPTMLEPNRLYWLTDRTPHECLPLKFRTFRKFFRLVSGDLSIWFKCSSTKNPLGVVPPKTTYVYQGNKFGRVVKEKYSHSAEVSRMLSHYKKFNEGEEKEEKPMKKRSLKKTE